MEKFGYRGKKQMDLLPDSFYHVHHLLGREEAIIYFYRILQKQWPATYWKTNEMALSQKVQVEKHYTRP